MKIRNKIISLFASAAIIICAAATNVLAQAKNFAGPSLAATGAFISNNTKINYNDGIDTGHIADIGENDITYGLDLAYAIPIDNNFLIGLGFTYGLNEADAGKVAGALNFKADNYKSIYIQPTYAFNNSFAGFVKLGYHELDGKATLTRNFDVVTTAELPDTLLAGSISQKFNGVGYGFGLKGLINQNIYLQAEVQFVDYDSEGGGSTASAASFSPETVSGIISVGYKF
jgi:opacity protein-like surface antigen